MRALAVSLISFAALSQSAFAQEPDNACTAGYLALQNDEAGRAAEHFESCLDTEELTPDLEAQIHSALGAAYLTENEFQSALNAFNMAFAIAQTQQSEIRDPSVWRNRGIARAQLDQTEGALSDLLIAAASMPDDVLTLLNLGVVYQQMGRPADAVVAYDRIVRLEPDWIGAWINRSSALLDAGMTGAAVNDARRAVELDPEDGSTLNMLCWTLIQDDRAEMALPLCEQAVAAEPEIGAIVHSHAAALEALGRMEEARPLYARAHDLSPEDPEISADFQRTHRP